MPEADVSGLETKHPFVTVIGLVKTDEKQLDEPLKQGKAATAPMMLRLTIYDEPGISGTASADARWSVSHRCHSINSLAICWMCRGT